MYECVCVIMFTNYIHSMYNYSYIQVLEQILQFYKLFQCSYILSQSENTLARKKEL